MANEVRIARQQSSLILYFAVRDNQGRVWDTSTQTFVAIDAIAWSQAQVGMPEQTSTGDYYGTFPAGISAGAYTIEIFEMVGVATPVRKDDILLATAQAVWRGGRLLFAGDVIGELMVRAGGVI